MRGQGAHQPTHPRWCARGLTEQSSIKHAGARRQVHRLQESLRQQNIWQAKQRRGVTHTPDRQPPSGTAQLQGNTSKGAQSYGDTLTATCLHSTHSQPLRDALPRLPLFVFLYFQGRYNACMCCCLKRWQTGKQTWAMQCRTQPEQSAPSRNSARLSQLYHNRPCGTRVQPADATGDCNHHTCNRTAQAGTLHTGDGHHKPC